MSRRKKSKPKSSEGALGTFRLEVLPQVIKLTKIIEKSRIENEKRDSSNSSLQIP